MTARIAIALLALSVGVGEARGDARAQMVRAMKAPQRTVIKPDAGTVAHVYWNGTALVDAKGNAWTMTGNVTQVPGRPAGAGPFAADAYYVAPNGTDVLDFAGDFTCRFVFDAGTLGANQILLSNGEWSGNGYYAQVSGGGAVTFFGLTGGTSADTVNTAVAGVNVASVGRSGGTAYAKLNAGAAVSAAGTVPAASGFAAKIGVYPYDSSPFTGVIYEVQCLAVAFSDATEAAAHAAVKAKLGGTAW